MTQVLTLQLRICVEPNGCSCDDQWSSFCWRFLWNFLVGLAPSPRQTEFHRGGNPRIQNDGFFSEKTGNLCSRNVILLTEKNNKKTKKKKVLEKEAEDLNIFTYCHRNWNFLIGTIFSVLFVCLSKYHCCLLVFSRIFTMECWDHFIIAARIILYCDC